MAINHLIGHAFAKKTGDTIHVFEGPHTLANFFSVIAEGSDVPRMLKDRFADVVNVRDFGAKGDGVTDDTSAFVAAAEKAAIVFVPKGSYLVSSLVHGNFVGDIGSTFPSVKVHVKRLDGKSARYMKRPVVGIRLIWSELQSYSQTRFTPQALAVLDDMIWLRMTPNEASPTDSRSWVGVFDIATGEKLSIFCTGAANPDRPVDQGLRVFHAQDGKRKLVCKYYSTDATSDGLAVYDVTVLPTDGSTISPIETHSNLNLGYDWFYADGYYYVQQHSYPDSTKYDRSVFVKYDENFNRVGFLCFSAADSTRVLNAYSPVEGEEISDVNTKPQQWAVKDGLIYSVCGAAYGEIEGAVSTYQGLRAFSSNGLKVDSTLCDPEKCLNKIESILPTTVGLIEPEGLCVDEYGVMYSIQQTVSNSSMTSSDKNFWLFEEYSDAVDAVDFSDAASLDAPINIDRLSIGPFPILGESTQTLVNPWTGEAFSNISQVLDYMVFSGQKVFCVNTQQAVINDIDGNAFPSSMLITLILVNSLTVQCLIENASDQFLLKNTSEFRYRKENNSWKKNTSRSIGPQNIVLGAGIDPSTESSGSVLFPNGDRTKLIKALSVSTSESTINRTVLGGSSANDSPNRIQFGVENSGSTYSSIQFAEKSFVPIQNNEIALGRASGLWTELFAGTGMINTSDQRVKSSVASASDTLLDAVGAVPIHTFQFTDAVEKKGSDAARFHVGVIAQEVASAFQAQGLDAARYGLFCHDEWQDEYETVEVVDQPEVLGEDGEVVTPAVIHTERRKVLDAGDRYGIRYEELLILECARLRRELQRVKTALTTHGITLGDES